MVQKRWTFVIFLVLFASLLHARNNNNSVRDGVLFVSSEDGDNSSNYENESAQNREPFLNIKLGYLDHSNEPFHGSDLFIDNYYTYKQIQGLTNDRVEHHSGASSSGNAYGGHARLEYFPLERFDSIYLDLRNYNYSGKLSGVISGYDEDNNAYGDMAFLRLEGLGERQSLGMVFRENIFYFGFGASYERIKWRTNGYELDMNYPFEGDAVNTAGIFQAAMNASGTGPGYEVMLALGPDRDTYMENGWGFSLGLIYEANGLGGERGINRINFGNDYYSGVNLQDTFTINKNRVASFYEIEYASVGVRLENSTTTYNIQSEPRLAVEWTWNKETGKIWYDNENMLKNIMILNAVSDSQVHFDDTNIEVYYRGQF